MPIFSIKFNTDNASFKDNFNFEVNNVMTQISSAMLDRESNIEEGFQRPIYDINGNNIGTIDVEVVLD